MSSADHVVVGNGSRVERVDPLLLLRRHEMSKKKVSLGGDEYLEFEDSRVHRSAKCGYRLGAGEPLLDIGSIWYMMRQTSSDSSYTETAARKHGFKYVGVAKRGDLCDYIIGYTEECPGLEKDVIEGRKRPKGAGEGEPRAKKALSRVSGSDVATEELSYADVMARVRPIKDLDVLVRCPGRSVPNAELILKIAQDEFVNYTNPQRRAQKESAANGKLPLYKELEADLVTDDSRKPIILVPCSKNAPVNIMNAKEFFQFGNLTKVDEEHQRFFESTRPDFVEVTRNILGKTWTFQVHDVATTFTKEQWLRTVLIISDGFDWQFKDWPFETIVDMFTTIKGVYFRRAGELIPTYVAAWQVAIVPLAPSSEPHWEHRFGAARDTVFTELEVFMNSCRVKKFVNHTKLTGERKVIVRPLPVL